MARGTRTTENQGIEGAPIYLGIASYCVLIRPRIVTSMLGIAGPPSVIPQSKIANYHIFIKEEEHMSKTKPLSKRSTPVFRKVVMKTVWEGIYKKGEFLKREPHPEIEEVAKLFSKERVRRVLDLGSGSGRHTVYLAIKGFDVYGLDSSYTGFAYTIRVLGEAGLTAHLTVHDMQSLPYSDSYFDAVISIQVIHHNKLENIVNTVKEITRVLKEGGLIWITMPVSKNEPSKRQKEIEPGTFVPLDGREKGLPHHYFRLEEIHKLFAGFSIIKLHVDVTNHFSLIARKNKK